MSPEIRLCFPTSDFRYCASDVPVTGAGALAHLHGELDRAQALGDTLLARAADYPYGRFWARLVLGMTAEARGDHDAARHHYAEGLAIAPDLRNPQNHRALGHGRLGALAQRAGDLAEAERHLDEALRLSEITGNAWANCCSLAKKVVNAPTMMPLYPR